MDVEKSTKPTAAFRQTCRAAALAAGVFIGPLMCVIFAIAFEKVAAVRAVAGLCAGAYGIRLLIRQINRRDDPRHTNRPSDIP